MADTTLVVFYLRHGKPWNVAMADSQQEVEHFRAGCRQVPAIEIVAVPFPAALAATELLEALRAAVKDLRDWTEACPDVDPETTWSVIAKAEAAIARATGAGQHDQGGAGMTEVARPQ